MCIRHTTGGILGEFRYYEFYTPELSSMIHTRFTLLFVAVAFCLTALTASAEEQNTLSPAEKRGGWKLLFDGETTDGWRNYKSDKIGEGWVVKDGALVRTKNGAGDIVSEDEYGSFELSLEYRISPEGNSGIMFLVTEDAPAPWHSGPEVQIQDNLKGHDPQKSGWLYQLYRPNPDPWTGKTADSTRPAGEWNHVQLRVTPADCEINVNGYRYAQFKIGSPDWKRRVAQSKFASFDQFAKADKGHICLQDHGNLVSFRNIKIRKLADDGAAPQPIDGTLPLKVVKAFPNLKWDGWEPTDERGRLQEFRPIVVTHAGDGSERLFVANQYGDVYTFTNKPDVTGSIQFLDIRDRVIYNPRQNEEGLLGFAFHPKHKDNGEFFVYYTSEKEPHTSIISRFKVKKDDPNRGDPDSEQQIMTIKQPYWNHNGGTIAFGPDGFLYIGLGDGGSANDPQENAQNLGTLLGSILRIDVDNADGDNAYAIPDDNPFVNKQDARPEIYAYGLRNVWRLSFDRETGQLWCGDVGQNLWEEINIIEKGGNYGWDLREATHAFGPRKVDADKDLIDPIWEYDHQVGKSITGGVVYRGKRIDSNAKSPAPILSGRYVYADYVTGKLWALEYDAENPDAVSNMSIPSEKLAVITFGEDEQGEVYFTTVSANGKSIYKFEHAGK